MDQPWGRGYYTGSTYCADFHRELSPNWLDLAALARGQRPPRTEEGARFRYLELGCGMGFGLCLLAAAYPEGVFTGVDFHPDHIAQARTLAEQLGLANLRFLEADFLSLQQDLRPLASAGEAAGSHDYVVAHGIATWVSAEVRQALLQVAGTALRPGGLFYCSYNTYPGWLGRSALQMLAGLERRIHSPTDPAAALDRAAGRVGALLGPPEEPLILGRELPGLREQLATLHRYPEAYRLGEYASSAWAPLYVAEMHELCAAHKLSPCATATLPELFEEFLDPARRAIVLGESDPLLRAALFDLAIHQTFRRDIFVKGRQPLSRHLREQALARLRFCRIAADTPPAYSFSTSLGTLEAPRETCGAIEAALAEAPTSLGELAQTLGSTPVDLLPNLVLLLHEGRLGIERGEALPAATAAALEVNRRLRELMQEGHNHGFLAAPVNGSAVRFQPLDALLLTALEQGLEGEMLPGCVLLGLTAIGGQLRSADGEAIDDPERQIAELTSHIDSFRSTTLPKLIRLGVIPAEAR